MPMQSQCILGKFPIHPALVNMHNLTLCAHTPVWRPVHKASTFVDSHTPIYNSGLTFPEQYGNVAFLMLMRLTGARGVTDWFPENALPLATFVCWKEGVSAELPSLFKANKASLQSPAHTTAKLIGITAVLCSESDGYGRINKSPSFTLNPQPWNCSLTVATSLFLLRVHP